MLQQCVTLLLLTLACTYAGQEGQKEPEILTNLEMPDGHMRVYDDAGAYPYLKAGGYTYEGEITLYPGTEYETKRKVWRHAKYLEMKRKHNIAI